MRKSMLLRFLLFAGFVLFYPIISTAQERTIEGVVTTFEDIHVAKANVKVVRTKEVVLTDTIGVFKITCLPGDKIRVSAKGFNSQTFRVTENTTTAFINLKLKPNPKNQELAVAYGHVKEGKNLNAVTSVNPDDQRYADFYSVYQILNQIPNVAVSGSDVIIRGKNSINGNGAALIVVDRIIQPSHWLKNLVPQNIKNVSVLKGVAASSYGARGANGVILITTKKGTD